MPTRREFIGLGVGGVAAASVGAAVWHELLASSPPSVDHRAPSYGSLRAPDEHGFRLPEGFEVRMVARGGDLVPGTAYRWHEASDGMATFPLDDGGWILVSNSEVSPDGGASAIRFEASGQIVDAYRILGGTERNCSGGGTPWGTWLSCEEIDRGSVWECDPSGSASAVRRAAMGVFKHEAAAVDPDGRRVYMTEDVEDGGLYRFTPDRWPSLESGKLEIAVVQRGGATSWQEVPDPAAAGTPTRYQVEGGTPFRRAEGIWLDDGTVFVATTSDSRIHAYDIAGERLTVLYDGHDRGTTPLMNVDQLTATSAGDIFVCEDNGAERMDVGVMDRTGRMSRFLSLVGPEHAGSEPTGVIFDPGERRMYLASQRAGGSGGAEGPGAVYEISGPFRGT